MKHALVTGGAGFIGSHLIERLLREGWKVTAIDNYDLFYDASVKKENIRDLQMFPNFILFELDIRDYAALYANLRDNYDVIVHLAAKAGVRPSILDPFTYQEVNIRGTQNMLEFAREKGVKQFVFASSSSVYGVNPNAPWREDDHVLLPISPYAATKVAGELLGHVYSHLHAIRFIALRFFTVFGPRQRPDLAIHKFARLLIKGKDIPVYGDGSTSRDYTYVSDIVQGICNAMEYTETDYEVINLGSHQTVELKEMIHILEENLGIKAKIQRLPDQAGDVPRTYADITKATKLLDYQPKTSFQEGISSFVPWIKEHF